MTDTGTATSTGSDPSADPDPNARSPVERLRPRRPVRGMSAILLPLAPDGEIDWAALAAHVERTAAAGLTPAVNMDTGYVQLLDASTRVRVLDVAAAACEGFVAGAHVADRKGDPFDGDGYRREALQIASRGGTPVLFPSHGLNALPGPEWVEAQRAFARDQDAYIGFELGPMFVPYGRIYELDDYRGLLEIPNCIGAKHSSLSRELEWQRLALRDAQRPDFMVLTGNDLAIDMVMYGSDYLLGLSTFAPDCFARRDRLWEAGDPAFYELNDLLQYLGFFAFRDPVPAYRHNAAQFLHLRGQIASERTPEGAPRRPHADADREVLRDIALRLGVLP